MRDIDRQRELADAIEGPIIDRALDLVAAVHGEGGPDDVRRVLSGVPDDQRDALVVVLAAMIDPSSNIRSMLGWVTWTLPADRAVA